MILLKRNVTEFEYLPYAGTETDLNDAGEHTGDYYPDYSGAVTYQGNISSPSGNVNQTFYGQDIRYTHVLVMDQPEADIRESGLIRWNDNLYEIMAVRPSMNVLSIALRQKTKDNAEDSEEDPEEEEEEPDDDTDGDGE